MGTFPRIGNTTKCREPDVFLHVPRWSFTPFTRLNQRNKWGGDRNACATPFPARSTPRDCRRVPPFPEMFFFGNLIFFSRRSRTGDAAPRARARVRVQTRAGRDAIAARPMRRRASRGARRARGERGRAPRDAREREGDGDGYGGVRERGEGGADAIGRSDGGGEGEREVRRGDASDVGMYFIISVRAHVSERNE